MTIQRDDNPFQRTDILIVDTRNIMCEGCVRGECKVGFAGALSTCHMGTFAIGTIIRRLEFKRAGHYHPQPFSHHAS